MEPDLTRIDTKVAHLVDCYSRAVLDFRVLAPMLYDPVVIARNGAGARSAGFISVRYGLYYHIIQECWKIGCDTGSNSPSVKRVIAGLGAPKVRESMRQRFATWTVPIASSIDDLTRSLFKRLDEQEESKRHKQFDQYWAELHAAWECFSTATYFSSIATARNKVTAHIELKLVEGKYKPRDLSDIGIKYGDERLFLEALRPIVTLLDLIVRGSSMAWDQLDDLINRDVEAFWTPS